MFPFMTNTNNFEYPLSGDVTQDISPTFFAAMNGVPEVEREVVTRVSSYGDQLGALTDAVLSLAQKTGVTSEEIQKLDDLAGEVKEAKDRVKAALRARADAALKRLKDADPDAYQALLADRKGEVETPG